MKSSVYSVLETILLLSLIIIVQWRDLVCKDVELSLLDTIKIWLNYMDEPIRCPKTEDVIFQAVAEFLVGVGTFVFPDVLVIVLCGFVRMVAASIRSAARLIFMVSVSVFLKPFNVAKFYTSRMYCVVKYAKDWFMHSYCSGAKRNIKEFKAESLTSKTKAEPNYRYNLRQTTIRRNNEMVTVYLVYRMGEDHVDVFEKCEEQGKFRLILSYDRK